MSNLTSLVISFATAILGCLSLAIGLPPPPPPAENTVYPELDVHFYEKERKGFHTGQWMPNSVTVYPRVKGHIQYCQSNHWKGTFVDFVDKVPSVEQTSDCSMGMEYVRDFRSDRYETTSLGNPYEFSLSSNDSWLTNGTYPINQDKVWQISVPKGYTVNISLSSLFGDQKKGRCGDYISLYADDDAPEVMCSEKLTNRSINKSGIEKLTIKFHSNSDDANGFFNGTVFLYPESESTAI
jgi:hypothetical protein